MTDADRSGTGTATAVDPDTGAPAGAVGPDPALLGVAGVAVVAGLLLVGTAATSALALLVGVAVVQAAAGVAWVFGTAMPGRKGALVLAALAAAGADVTVSVWPDGRLGTLLPVLGLALPAMFAHQLLRGAARVQLVSSLSAVAVLVVLEVSVAAYAQLRHEFPGDLGGRVVGAVAGAAAAAVVVSSLVDTVLPAPRFDREVPRGLLGLLGAAAVGGCVGALLLRDERAFADGRALYLGAAVGALAGLLAIAAAFVLHTTPAGRTTLARTLRPVLAALLPVCVSGPAAFLLALAVRA